MNAQAANNYNRRLEHLRTCAELLASAAPTVSAAFGEAGTELLLKRNVPEQEKARRLLLKSIQERRKEVCCACGSLMVPGWTHSFRMATGGRRSKRPREEGPKEVRARQFRAISQDQNQGQDRSSAQKNNHSILTKPSLQAKKSFPKKVVYACVRCNRPTVFTIPDRTLPPKKRDRRESDIHPVATVQSDQQRHLSNFGEDDMTINYNDRKKQTDASDADTAAISTLAQKKLLENANSKKRAKSRKQGALLAILNKKTTENAPNPGFNLMDFMKPL